MLMLTLVLMVPVYAQETTPEPTEMTTAEPDAVAGIDVTPTSLATLTEAQVAELSRRFGAYFECELPAVERIKDAIVGTLARWPVGSLGETA